eukprot:31269-Pelagococcus_subviridis.AAC.1
MRGTSSIAMSIVGPMWYINATSASAVSFLACQSSDSNCDNSLASANAPARPPSPSASFGIPKISGSCGAIAGAAAANRLPIARMSPGAA